MLRSVLLLGAVVASVAAGPYVLTEPPHDLRTLFGEWRERFGRVEAYATPEEEANALANFEASVASVVEQNTAGEASWKAGLNAYSDMSWDEFRQHFRLDVTAGQNCSATHGAGARLADLKAESRRRLVAPDAIDWRDMGAVSAVKNQGSCGSCWTFSTTGAMESHHFLATGQMTSLAEQQLVDCAAAFDNHGCEGGLPSHAFEYIHYSGGIVGEASYPYTAKDGSCSYDASKVEATVKSVFNVTYQDEAQLHEALGLFGPVSVAFEVAGDFKQYDSGVYSNPRCGTGPEDVNHAVLAVGYGTSDEGVPYYIVKNSWGTDFGMDGYFWIEAFANMCGIANCNSFPLAG